MRARTYKAAHRHLADSKRSIVMACAGLAMILGTTSVGASLFSFSHEPTLIERTGASVVIDANGDNEVPIDEPTVQILQGQIIAIPRKTAATLPEKTPTTPLQVGSIVANQLINQLHPNGSTTPAPTAGNTSGGTGNGTVTVNPPGDTPADPDNGGITGDTGGGLEEDPDLEPDEDGGLVPDDTSGQQQASGNELQGSSIMQDVTL